jgi:hypothetical protein
MPLGDISSAFVSNFNVLRRISQSTEVAKNLHRCSRPVYYRCMKIGRNKPCPCGSGKKYKKCHGDPRRANLASAARSQFQTLEAREKIRQAQQGRGRPIISAQHGDNQLVAVGKHLHFSPSWKTFIDFLSDYIKTKMGSEWGNAEIAKPFHERHCVIQWYDAVCRYQKRTITEPGKPTNSELTGAVACYYSVAYGLYLLEHNVELQERMLKRLKNPGNFQGAYYEILVASALIRAGFDLTLEDETDSASKHCEFFAVSKETGKRYWIEAKMRAVAGLLGRNEADGTRAASPISHLIPHLNAALAKPASDDRMIFIDLNFPIPANASDENRPAFVKLLNDRLKRYEERELEKGVTTYLFVTCADFHRKLDDRPQLLAVPFGLGMPDFNRPGHYNLAEIYRRDKKHSDALRVAESLSGLLSFPATLDGSLPATTLMGEPSPLAIAETYNFEGAAKDGSDLIGTVTDAIVDEAAKQVTVAVQTAEGAHLLKEQMTDAQFADYLAFPDAYFGKIRKPGTKANTPYDLFLFFMSAYQGLSSDELRKRMAGRVPGLAEMEHDDLLATYCEGLVAVSGAFKTKDGISQASGWTESAAQVSSVLELLDAKRKSQKI